VNMLNWQKCYVLFIERIERVIWFIHKIDYFISFI